MKKVKTEFISSAIVDFIDTKVNEFLEKEINGTTKTLVGPVSFQTQIMGDGRPHAFALVTYSYDEEN